MSVTIGINGFGRIARCLTRIVHAAPESGITIGAVDPWRVEIVDYPHALVRLNFCKVAEWTGELHMHEGQQCAWEQLPVRSAPVLPGTVPVLAWFAQERGFAGATHAGG